MRDRQGKFIKGSPPGPGRPAGSPEKVTKNAREILVKILDNQMEYVGEALDRLREKDEGEYVNTIARLLNFIIPKKTEQDVNTTNLELHEFLEALPYDKLYYLKYGKLPERIGDEVRNTG